ncbi:DNA-binding protein, CopG family [Candidatus Burkholderia pumila]|uniref:DNA-binding protein, CopG family n=1 Tax=Candidatus Burkholderia pumila TaxID=1090375 RepID=A0ABR5HLB7_9BURK|nr:DNA-binding protein, CopG family [Candidatus Burkholderia pumila]
MPGCSIGYIRRKESAIAIRKDPSSSYGVTPGAFTAGDMLEEAIENAKEVIFFHIEPMLEAGEKVTINSTSRETLEADPDYQGAKWVIVNVDLSALEFKPERANIDSSRLVLHSWYKK